MSVLRGLGLLLTRPLRLLFVITWFVGFFSIASVALIASVPWWLASFGYWLAGRNSESDDVFEKAPIALFEDYARKRRWLV